MITREQLVRGFNEWLRRYIADPAAFEAEFQTVAKFQSEELDDVLEPSYGDECVAYLEKIMAEPLIVRPAEELKVGDLVRFNHEGQLERAGLGDSDTVGVLPPFRVLPSGEIELPAIWRAGTFSAVEPVKERS
jgi:hypothetical protein